MTVFKYSKKFLTTNLKMAWYYLVAGLVFLIINFVADFPHFSISAIAVGFLATAVAMFILYRILNKRQFLILEDDVLTKNSFFKKRTNLKNLKKYTDFAGDITLYSDDTKMVINTQHMDLESLIKLKEVIKPYLPKS